MTRSCGADYSSIGMFRGPLRRLVATIGLIAWIAGLALPAFGGQHVADLADAGADVPRACSTRSRRSSRSTRASVTITAPICHLQRAASGATLIATGGLIAVSSALSDPAVDQHAYASLSLIAHAPARASSRSHVDARLVGRTVRSGPRLVDLCQVHQ